MTHTTQARVLALAQEWIGTPYRHQASCKGVGCDCLGLVRGIWRELYGTEPETPLPYAPDWAEHGREDRLLQAAFRHFGKPLSAEDALPGDLLLFRWQAHMPAKHLAIFDGPDHFIHAYEQAAVVRSALVPFWRRRIAGIFRFPETMKLEK